MDEVVFFRCSYANDVVVRPAVDLQLSARFAYTLQRPTPDFYVGKHGHFVEVQTSAGHGFRVFLGGEGLDDNVYAVGHFLATMAYGAKPTVPVSSCLFAQYPPYLGFSLV